MNLEQQAEGFRSDRSPRARRRRDFGQPTGLSFGHPKAFVVPGHWYEAGRQFAAFLGLRF